MSISIVVAASDGLKAWNTLKEKPQSIDLVLTEVDLPSISGFALLTLMMDHDPCKKIPVIMMSSHDSMSIVFKCMLKGAADFLIKPIRRNELRNLWQHVWRRQIVSGSGELHEIQDNCEEKHNLKSHSGERENSAQCMDIMQANKECSEQGSDAHSSCTRYDMEAQSTHRKQELPIASGASMDQNGQNIQMKILFNHEIAAKVDAMTAIKERYRIQRNWMGDPCSPRDFVWDGLNCNYNLSNSPRVTTLSLSSSGLTGEITKSFASLSALQYLDLSYNNLTGPIPDDLANLSSLKLLDLTGNQLNGSVPSNLLEMAQNGLLTLRLDGNPHLCYNGRSCDVISTPVILKVYMCFSATGNLQLDSKTC